jgi:endonuclease/exonuclease/phosphatase family metal-dependent hydrolase
MKILNWNVERYKKNKSEIDKIIHSYNADIVVLTETSSKLDLGNDYQHIKTENLSNGFDGVQYDEYENRVSIWTRYKILNKTKTYDEFTSINANLETEYGNLNVYATIIGVFGGKGERFNNDLNEQILDFHNFNSGEMNCIIGDLNTTFSGFTYPSHLARKVLNEQFSTLNMENVTKDIDNNVDHIIISNSFIKDKKIVIDLFNTDKKLSDHIGICISISK